MSRPPDRLHTDETETAEVAGETPVTAVEPRGPRARPVTPALAVAGRVDRFLILEKLGEGGMGAVYVAYDTLLDRKVAMKVVRPDRRSSMGGISPRERLLREAQAMARLSHPNVVAVLEVGELDDDVYLALELVEGTTLKAWMRAQRRPWPEVIAHFVAAGRGLAAAHEAGLVHRDFKPDNVLIGSDGRVRVADFGVVSMSHGQRESSSSPSPGVEPDASGASDAFTFSGMRVGTPAYMPPEQYEGEAVDARADQFSFCVALWEALYGERPFPPLAPGASFRDRPMRPLPESTDVPGWLEPLLRRGLSVDPAARWPSMAALIEELARD
ncbi:MAG: serine/threonine protein kinase, partial [Deltaproteobacteria bacterium]|nr:serine/threonine protein kinase [Kofleriaceae bacterium]